jgi:tRNA U34 2-thiouridine synthase MnmA/TrmU
VLRTDRETNTVVVGAASASTRVETHGRLYAPVERASVKLRYRSPAVSARVAASNGGFAVELDEPVDAVAPGQVAALYDGDAVVGAGVITTVA